MKYNIVICQAFLIHIPDPECMLSKMIDASIEGGLIIFIEPNWNVSNAATYIDGLDIDRYCNLGILQKLWKNEIESEYLKQKKTFLADGWVMK